MALATFFEDTIAGLLQRLGDIPPGRVLLRPVPGTAKERDVVTLHDRQNRLCELVYGVLVEKTCGLEESACSAWLGYFLIVYLKARDVGRVLGPDGAVRLKPGLVRIPDVSFFSWDRFERAGGEPFAEVAPDLVVEVLSKGNTKREMDRKLREYFEAGVRLVWYVDPKKRTARVYTAPNRSTLLREDDDLEGGDVLPGFRLRLRDWFDEAGQKGPMPG